MTCSPTRCSAIAARSPALGCFRWGGVALIAVASCVAYFPALHGQFLLDDNMYLTDAPLIRAADGLRRFWFTSEALDYYPVSNTSLWVEWRLWGLDPLGYHLTNLLVHIASCLLLWAILRQMAIGGAFPGGAVVCRAPAECRIGGLDLPA